VEEQRFHVKHLPDPARTKELVVEAARVGASLTDSQATLLCGYIDRILELNRHQNLTRIHEPRSAVSLHLVDSLSAMPELDAAPTGELLDVGTGAGFPGVPLAVASGRQTTVIDSSGKKIAAVNHALSDAGIRGVRALSVRAEELALAEPRRFAAVTARAVAPLAALLELIAPLLALGGHAILLKGSPDTAELDAGNAAATMLGLSLSTCRDFVLPAGEEHRTVIVFRQVAEPTISLPRRTGMAQKRPLG
jgi:16S rRNA (guanine527-N7)-methyltransferase